MQKVTDPALLSQLNGGSPSPAPAGAPGIIVGRPKAPDPYEVGRDQVTDANTARDNARADAGDVRSTKGQVQDYRKEFTSSMPVKTYGIAIQSLSNAIKRGEDGSGDVALIYDYAKAMDPESVVRESEVGMAQSGQSVIESAATRLKKELGIAGGGVLTPDTRQRLRREIINAARSRLQSYEQQREYFTGIANRSNYNPEDIIGPHLGAPFREELSNFGVSGRRFTNDEMAARAARQAGKNYRPNPDEIAFGMDAPGSQTNDSVVDRLTPQQEAQLAAYLKARSGDKSFSPEEYQAFAKSIGVTGDLALAPELVDAVRNGSDLPSGIDYSQADAARRKEMEALLSDRGMMDAAQGGQAGFDAGVFANFSDELAGLAGGTIDAVQGGDFGEGYRRERDVVRTAQKIGREERGVAPEIAGALLSPLNRLGGASTAREFVKQGVAFGALAGAGAGEGLPGTATNALLGAGAGAAVGGALSQAPKAVNALLATGPGQRVAQGVERIAQSRRTPVSEDVINAGNRQNVPIRLADAVPSKSREFARLESNPNVGQKVQTTLSDDIDVFAQRVAGVGGESRPAVGVARGDMIQNAAKRNIARTRQQANTLYNRAKQEGADETVDAAPFIRDVDNRIADLKANGEDANSGIISLLEGMKRDLSSGITVGKLQAQRTTMRSRLERAGLTMDPNQAQLNDALGVAADTLKSGFTKPSARAALEEADAFYAQRQGFINGVLKHFTDRKGAIPAETAAKRFDQYIKEGGNFRVAQKMFNELEPSEREAIRATVASTLGKNNKGEFSLPIFLNNVSGRNAALSERSKFLLFGRDGVRALRDLQIIAKAKTEAGSAINNSRSATIAEAGIGKSLRDVISGAFGLGGGAALSGGEGVTTLAATGAAVVGGRLASMGRDAWKARLMLNPDFTKWLRQAPETTNPAAINRYFDRLNKIASREQSFLMDAQALQEFMRKQFSEGVGRAAASGDNPENNGRK